MKSHKSCLSRRDFLKLSGIFMLSGMAAGAGGFGYMTRVEPAWLDVTQVSLRLPRLDSAFAGLRLVQISDIHFGGWINAERFQKVIERVLEQQPDVVAITGDFLHGYRWSSDHPQQLAELAEALRSLVKACLTVGVLGNHDCWTDASAVRAMFADVGIVDLSNTVHTLRRGGDLFHLAGVDDVWEEHDKLEEVLAQLPEDGAAILLAHEPDFADESGATGRFDLQISGHSHGGQVALPFIGPPITPYLAHKYPSGLYRVGEMLLYTNRGVGMVDVPIRFNCRPEITVFTLS
ncbi:MAG: metallophosphoesterase [Anaerolineales bacterium]|nr:metallophosphoesterase [Anaerolineales bacterium]